MVRKNNIGQDLPPYFNISAEKALEGLPPGLTTADMGKLANECRKCTEDLEVRSLKQSKHQPLRLFSIWEITTYIIPIAAAHFRRVLRQNPDLPQGSSETDGSARWFTLEEVLQLRNFLAAQGSKSKEYLPYRPNKSNPKIVTVTNGKSNIGKTSTCFNLALAAALDGYRILIVDLDSQASMTSNFEVNIKSEYKTIYPIVAKNYALHLRSENLKRIDRGDPPLPFEDILTKSLEIKIEDLIIPTKWVNIDIIGAHQKLNLADLKIANWRVDTKNWKYWNSLFDAFRKDEYLQKYDLIFIDTSSVINMLTLNGITAANILIVPIGATFPEFEATSDFLEMMHSIFSSIEDFGNIAARALGREEFLFKWDAIQSIMTKFEPSKQTEIANIIQNCMGKNISAYRQNFTSLLKESGSSLNSVYEVDYRDFNRDTYIRERISFDESYASFKKMLIGLWLRDQMTDKNITG